MVRRSTTPSDHRAIPVLEQVFPTKEQREKGCAQQVQLMTIWFGNLIIWFNAETLGANDAVLPGCRQHVPLDRFKANLSHLIGMIQSPSSPWYSPDTRIVLITAPPIIPADRERTMISRWREFGSVGDPPKPDRDPLVTKQYSDAAVEAAKTAGVEVVDAWNAVVETAGGDDPEKLAPFF